MITVRVMGGLGNQLFQYATAYSLAQRLNQKLQLDISFFPKQALRGYKLENLNIEFVKAVSKQVPMVEFYKNRYINRILRAANIRSLPYGEKSKYLLETRSDIMPEFFEISGQDIYIDGYYQSEKYFKEFQNDLIRQFMPNYKPESEFENMLSKIYACNSVAVHVRRGDFLKAKNDRNPNHYLLNETYYYNALRYIYEKLELPEFFWFSDDIEWVKQNFGEKANFHYVNLHSKQADIDEMMLMKNCKHIIAANSTFSWWASWLNENGEAMHICPARRYGNLLMIPETWTRISVE